MFDIGGPELFFLMILALLIFGPRRLPQIGRQLGGFVAQMRHAMRDMQGTLEREVALEDVKGAIGEVKGIQRDATAIARELAGFGPPPYVDPNRRRDLPPGTGVAPEPAPSAGEPGASRPSEAAAAPSAPSPSVSAPPPADRAASVPAPAAPASARPPAADSSAGGQDGPGEAGPP
jgi:sec-independent protein translocase protein TatB